MSQYDNLVMALDPVLSSLGEQLFHNEEYSNGLVAGSTHARAFGASERQDSQTSIDLMHFAQLLSENLSETEIEPILDELIVAIDRFVVHANHDGSRPNSFGIAIDAPENVETEYSAYKINSTWLDFQNAYRDFHNADTEPPVVIGEYTDTDGAFATVLDDNLAKVTTLYGFVQPAEYEDGSLAYFFMVVAEEPA